MIILDSIQKIYNTPEWAVTIFDNTSITIQPWEFIAVMGPSWSGKSTLLNMISWLDKPTQGQVHIWWKEITKYNDNELTKRRWNNISFIFQSFHLLPHLTVAENITLPVQLNNLNSRYTVDEILEKVWLSHKKNAYPFNLSGWEQQRVAIARAFIWETPILLADEPTGNLDENNAVRIIELIQQLHKDTWTTIIMITHDNNIAKYAQTRYTLNNHTLHLID